MSRAFLPLLCAAAVLLGTSGCEQKKTAAEVNAEKEKTWRVQQKTRAAKYYQELAEKYPESPFAEQAKQRLQALGPIATPKPGAGARPSGAKPPGGSPSSATANK